MIECDVIRDLMPLYAEGLASEATRRVVETQAAGSHVHPSGAGLNGRK